MTPCDRSSYRQLLTLPITTRPDDNDSQIVYIIISEQAAYVY